MRVFSKYACIPPCRLEPRFRVGDKTGVGDDDANDVWDSAQVTPYSLNVGDHFVGSFAVVGFKYLSVRGEIDCPFVFEVGDDEIELIGLGLYL